MNARSGSNPAIPHIDGVWWGIIVSRHELRAEIKKLDAMSGRVAFATLYLADKNYAAAFVQFDEVLRERPDDFLALYHIGRCAALSGQQLDRGLEALKRCLSLSPPSGDGMPTIASVRYRLANILERKGALADANAEYEAVAKQDPDFRPAKIALKN
jgi:tetratricopeptide (TPR) repeat protein